MVPKGLGACPPGKLGATQSHLWDMVDNCLVYKLNFLSLKRFMNHMMGHYSYIILCNHTKWALLDNVTIVKNGIHGMLWSLKDVEVSKSRNLLAGL